MWSLSPDRSILLSPLEQPNDPFERCRWEVSHSPLLDALRLYLTTIDGQESNGSSKMQVDLPNSRVRLQFEEKTLVFSMSRPTEVSRLRNAIEKSNQTQEMRPSAPSRGSNLANNFIIPPNMITQRSGCCASSLTC
jgi:hypothetical protein